MNTKKLIAFLLIINICHAFPIKRGGKDKICKNLRVRSRLFLRNSYQDLKSEDSQIINSFKTIVKDDITNDVLYYLKFYHLTNDNINAYIYIVFYETLSLIIKNKKINLPLLINNIIIYMTFKIMLLQHLIHHII